MAEQKKVLIIATSYGVEADEIMKPMSSLLGAGHVVRVATPENEGIHTLVMDRDAGSTVDSDVTIAESRDADYDLLLIPGGTLNADALRMDADALRVVKGFAAAGKPIAAICHAPWVLVDAEIAVGKTLTSFPSLRADIDNAGATWVDEPVVVDDTNGFPLITSRTPDDMEQFTDAVGAQLA